MDLFHSSCSPFDIRNHRAVPSTASPSASSDQLHHGTAAGRIRTAFCYLIIFLVLLSELQSRSSRSKRLKFDKANSLWHTRHIQVAHSSPNVAINKHLTSCEGERKKKCPMEASFIYNHSSHSYCIEVVHQNPTVFKRNFNKLDKERKEKQKSERASFSTQGKYRASKR